MFVLFGLRRVFLKSFLVKSKICPACKNHNSIIYNIYRRHFHIFWIPIFPLLKIYNAKCNQCLKEFLPKEIPDELLDKAKGKKWQFTGSILILIIIAFVYFSPEKQKDSSLGLLKNPKSNDRYTYNVNKDYVSTMRVDFVTDDSVYVFPNNLIIPKTSFKIFTMERDKNYLDITIGYTKQEIVKMGKDTIITFVKRADQ